MAIQAEEQAELAFSSHDWDSDLAWKSKLSQVYFSNATDEMRAVMRLKRKYFRAEINSNLSLDPPKYNSTQQTSGLEQPSCDIDSFDFKRRIRISVNYACLFLHTFNLLAVLGYLFSFGSVQFASSCFRSLMISSIIALVLQILVKYGKPRKELSYAQLILADEQSHFIFMYFSMLFAHPIFLAIVPVCIRSALFLGTCLDKAILPMFFPQHHRKVLPYLNLLQDKQTFITDWLSQLDVALGFILLLSLLTSARQPMATLLFWQYLRIRYMFSSSGKAALQSIRRTLDSYLLHPQSPLIIQKIYLKIQQFAYSTVDPDQARARQNQFQNAKCQIM